MRPPLGLVFSILLGCAAVAAAQDADKVSPDTYKVEIDNQWVRVFRMTQGPHQVSPMHAHPATVVIYLSDVHQKIADSGGKSSAVAHKYGDVAYFNAGKHTEENASDQPLSAVVIELKPGAPHSDPIKLDPVKLDPEHHLVPLENDKVRVLLTILEPHLASPVHEHPHYVVVYITDLHTTMKLGDGREVDNPRRSGDIAWRDYQKHQTENIGSQTAKEIQVELK